MEPHSALRQTNRPDIHFTRIHGPPTLSSPARRKGGTFEMEGGEKGFLLWVAGETPPDLPHLLKCLNAIGMRPWNLRTREVRTREMRMGVKVHPG